MRRDARTGSGDPASGPPARAAPAAPSPAPDRSAPRATHEYDVEEAVRQAADAYVRYRDGRLFRAVALDASAGVVELGRGAGCGVRVQHDARVCDRHARFVRRAGQWAIEDGPAGAGTFVDERRTDGAQVLADGAQITVGRTLLTFRARPAPAVTPAAARAERRLRPTPSQREVLVELARPLLQTGGGGAPLTPTDAAIARQLGYKAATVRDAIVDLYRQAGLERGADERAQLVALAIREGLVARDDLGS